MKILTIAIVSVLSSLSIATPVWYNGDDDGNGGYAALTGTPNGQNNFESLQYEDFVWDSTSNASTVMGTMVGTTSFSQVKWEIRQGMGIGNNSVGTVLATGFFAPTLISLGSWAFVPSMTRFTMTGTIGSVALTNGGTYFLGMGIVVPNSTFTGGFTTAGPDNAVGSPLDNHSSMYIDSNGNVHDNFNGNTGFNADLSMGIGTSPVPEPGSFAVIGLGMVGLLVRKKAKATSQNKAVQASTKVSVASRISCREKLLLLD
jgi:hypothetical protein